MNPISAIRQQIEQLAPHLWSNEVHLKRGDILLAPGTVDKHTYYVEEGVVRIFYQTESEEHTIRFAYQESIFASLYSVLGNVPTLFYYQALRKTRLRKVGYQELRDFMASQEEFKDWWTTIMEQLVLDQMEREIDLLTESPRERYQRVLARSPQLFQEVPHKYIASYLRMTPETLSRLKNS